MPRAAADPSISDGHATRISLRILGLSFATGNRNALENIVPEEDIDEHSPERGDCSAHGDMRLLRSLLHLREFEEHAAFAQVAD
jgi:hypothetical protein